MQPHFANSFTRSQDEVFCFKDSPHPEEARRAVSKDADTAKPHFSAPCQLVRRDMEILRRDLAIRLGGLMVVAVGIVLAAIRYLPPAPHP